MRIESIHSHKWAFASCAKVKGCEGLELAKSLVCKLVYATRINPASGSWLTVSHSCKREIQRQDVRKKPENEPSHKQLL